MVVSVIVIIVNLGTVIPSLLDTENGQEFHWTRGKLILVLLALVYFGILIVVIKSPIKPEALIIDSSCDTYEVSSIIFYIIFYRTNKMILSSKSFQHQMNY
jgi:hypothetical protein